MKKVASCVFCVNFHNKRFLALINFHFLKEFAVYLFGVVRVCDVLSGGL